MQKEIKMPRLSSSMKEGLLGAWRIQPRERVQKGDVLFEIETDKVVSEVEAPCSGWLSRQCFEEGDMVDVGETVCIIETDGEDA